MAAGAAFLLFVGACAPPNQVANNIVQPSPTPTPSPSPTPTTAFAASGPGFHAGEVGIGYAAVALSVGGGVQPYHWSVATGALPPGLNLGNDGSVSGSPTAAGTFAFTIQVTDSGDSKASIPGTIKVAPHLTAALLPACAQACNVELGCANACGAFGSYSGGIAPYTFTLTQGPLPAGTSLSPNALTLNGTFGGQTGYLQFTVQVGDAFGATATVSPTFWMYPHITLGAGKPCYSTYYLFPCSTALPFSGGTPGTGFSVSVLSAAGQLCKRGVTGGWVCNPTTSPPPMFSATVGNGVVNVTVPAQPNNPFEYAGTVTLVLTAQDLCGPGTNCTATAGVQVTFAGG